MAVKPVSVPFGPEIVPVPAADPVRAVPKIGFAIVVRQCGGFQTAAFGLSAKSPSQG